MNANFALIWDYKYAKKEMNKEYFEWRFELSKKNIALTGFLKIKTKQGLKGTLPVPETKEVILLMKTSTNLIFLPVNETKTPLQFFTFSQKTTSQFRYADSSPTGQFPTKTFPRTDISLTTCFSEIFFSNHFLFVCTRIY